MVCQLANALVERGFTVVLISLDEPESCSYYEVSPHITWYRLGAQTNLSGKLHRTRHLVKVLRQNRVQVFVGFVMSGDKTIYAATKLANVKLVVAERNAPSMYTFRYSKIQRLISWTLLRLADCILVQMSEHINGYPERLRQKISVIHNPVPAVAHRAKPESPGDGGIFTLLAVSRLDAEQKGLATLIRAFAPIASRYPSWHLKIIGSGPQEEVLRNIIKDNQLSKQVHIKPPQKDIFKEYRDAHLFVMPSLWEGFPNALAEAMSHGLPAVGFEKAAGVAELILQGDGWLASGLDDEISLSASLSIAMGADAERAIKGKKAALGMEKFEPDKQFDKWSELLSALTAKEA